MANCQVKYDSKGNIQTVYDKAGNESQLFLSIAKLPMVKNLEEALEIYKQTYAQGIADSAEIILTPGFESNIQRALENIKDKNVKNVKGWVNQLTDVQKTGVRYVNQELEWIGLEDYLKDWVKENKPKNGNIPFDVVDQYVKDNQIEIEEVTKGGGIEKIEGTGADFRVASTPVRMLYDSIKEVYVIYDGDKVIGSRRDIGEAIDEGERVAAEKYNYVKEIDREETRHSTRVLEGGENYREVLLTLPIKKESDSENTTAEVYKSPPSHWSERNILAFVRINERTLPNGERVLFVEEVQSDWAQEGRKDGFYNESTDKTYKQYLKDDVRFKELQELITQEYSNLEKDEELSAARETLKDSGFYIGTNFNGDGVRHIYNEKPTRDTKELSEDEVPNNILKAVKVIDEKSTKIDGLRDEIKNLSEKYGEDYDNWDRIRRLKPVLSPSGVPNMPYKNTDQWVGMSMRRVMQMAAQEGFDRVAWVTGEQSADRYSLSQQIESLDAEREEGGTDWRIKFVDKNGESQTGYTKDSELEATVGKEMAERIRENEGGFYEGLGLEVGGEGMKAFYNQILPKVALKEAQRFDKKSKVEVVDFRGRTTIRNAETISEMVDNLEANKNRTESQNKDLQELLEVQKAAEKDASTSVQKQLSIKITPRAKAILTGAVPLFQNNNLPKGTLPNKVRGNNVMEVGDTKVYFKRRENPITGEVLPGIELDLIETAPGARGQGSAKKAMTQFLEYADRTKQKVYVVISPRDNSTTEEGIKAFNRQFGFKDDSDFEMSRNPQKIKTIGLKELSKQLGKNQLAEKVRILSPKQIEQELISRGVDTTADGAIQTQQEGIGVLPNGFVDLKTGEVFLNEDTAGTDTPIHEFSHLFNSLLKQTNPELYRKGLELIEKEGKVYKDFVKLNQPELEGEALLEEALAQAVGESGEKLLDKQSSLFQWIKDMWDSLKDMIGLTQYSWEEVRNMNLEQFSEAMAIDLLRGDKIGNATNEGGIRFSMGLNNLNKFENLIKEGTWGMLTAENPNAKQDSTENNLVNNNRAKEWLSDRGYTYKEIKGKYGNRENSFLVPNLSYADAVEFAKEFKQESVDTNQGLVYQDGLMNPINKGNEIIGGQFDDFYSTITLEGEEVNFSVDYDFSKKVLPNMEYYRGELDKLTEPIVRAIEDADQDLLDKLLSSRDSIVSNIAEYKKNNNMPILDTNREEALLSKVRALSKDKNVEAKFREILDNSKKLQRTSIDNRSATTQGFFSDVVTGVSDKYKPLRPWTPQLAFNTLEKLFLDAYNKFKGNFDEHIATSIPTFRELQVKVGTAIQEMYSSVPKSFTQELVEIKDRYKESKGLTKEPVYIKVDKDFFKGLSKYHQNTPDDRGSREMKKSYRAFLDETKSQYEALVEAGYTIEPWMGKGEPYGVNSNAVREDVINNKHLYYLRSRSATGENNQNETADNYMPFEESGIVINGDKVLMNDLFRAVHDIMGHVMAHNSFSTQGEYNAYHTHAPMYSNTAQKALFLETVVYNAWYSENKNYAPRKIYNIPQEFIDKANERPLVYDIGGSEGGFVKAITEQTGGTVRSINLDANPDMRSSHEKLPVKGSEFIGEAFYESFKEDGHIRKKHTPKEKADVVHESMTFQFISPERAEYVKEVKDKYVKEDGIFLTEEKLVPSDEQTWLANEREKDQYKLQYYSQEQLDTKSEEVLVGMRKNQTLEEEYVKVLQNNFKHVVRYWSATNFKGYAASDSKENLDTFIENLGGEVVYDHLTATNTNLIEPELSFKNADSYQDALNKGQDIEIGLETRDGFKTLVTIPYNVNPETAEGFVNKYIKEGFINEERILKDGKQYYTIKGVNYLDRKNKEIILKEDMVAMLGAERTSVKKGLVEVKDKVKAQQPLEDGVVRDIVEEVLKSQNLGGRRGVKPKKLNEEELKLKLLTLLNKMGVETMSIAEYIEKYNKKNGIDPSVRALADTVNRVVAFKDGIITLEDLTEEVMHIIVETLPQAEIEGILRNIHRTTEYSQYSQQYREVYTKAYPNLNREEIEGLVRKEVLGKVLKNSTLGIEEGGQSNFYQRALEYIGRFFDRIMGREDIQTQLKEINKKIEELFIQEKLDEYLDNNLNSKAFPMYSLGSQPSGDRTLDLARSIQKSILNSLKQSYSTITKSYGALYADKVRVQKLEEMVDGVTQASAASDFLGLVKRQVDFVNRSVRSAQNNNTALSIEARQVVANLGDSLKALLERQRDVINKMTPEQLGLKSTGMSDIEAEAGKKALLNKVSETLLEISVVTGEAANVFDNTFNDIIDRISMRHNLSPDKIEHLRSQAEMMNSEIGFFMETFGQLIHSSDALLNIAAHVVEEMWGKQAAMTQERMRKFTAVMEANGITPDQMSQLFDNGYLMSQYDFPKFSKDIEKMNLDIYNEIFKESLTQKEYDDLKSKDELQRFDAAQNNTAQRLRTVALSEMQERRMNEEYYKAQAIKYEKLNISKYTIDQMRALSLQRAIVQEAATDASGKVVYTEENTDELDALSQIRKGYKSVIDNFGALKKGYLELSKEEATARGIDITDTSSGKFIEINNLIYTLEPDATNEAILSFELHLIDKDFENTGRKRNTEAFLDKFVEIANEQGMESGISFLENNIGVSFSSQFWDSISTENILDNVDVNMVPGNAEIIKRIRQKRNRLSLLKKLYQDPMNPQEVKGNEMSETEQEIIKNLVEDIDIEMGALQIPDTVERSVDFESEVSINQSYKDELGQEVKQELGKEEFKFIRKHVTSQNESYLIRLENTAQAIDRGAYFGSDKTKEMLERYMEDGDTYYNAFVRMARTRVLPYYKRYTPVGYRTVREVTSEATSDTEKMNSLMDYIYQMETDPNYELNIHYSFDEASKDINPMWDNSFEGGMAQPKLSKYLNPRFVAMFDPVMDNGRFTGKVRKNEKLYNVQKALIELQGANLDSIGQRGVANIYKLPQVSRTRTNQVADLLRKSNKGATLKEMFRDTFTFRIDDLEYGNAENNVQLQKSAETRTVPTFYTRNLEDPKDLTDDLFYSYLAMTNQSVLHQVRREGITDIRAVEDKMLSRENPQGKSAQATRNYKMLKSYINYNYYGVKESTSYKVTLPLIGKEIDLTKILRQLNGYVKLRNLGLNFIVPITSYITAEVNTQIEATLGEYFSRDSLREASKEYGKLVKEAGFRKNSLSYNDKSTINVLGEWLGQYNMTEKAANAKYPTLMRWLPKIGMVLHQVGNFPIVPRIYLSILHDHKVVGGKLVSRRQFMESHSDKKSAKARWRDPDNKTLYSYLKISETGVEISPELLDDLGGDQAYLDAKMQAIRSLIKDQVEKIDGMIPESQRVEAQRNAVFNYLMTHRGWLSIGAQKRFKGLQLNLETGQMEEGTYVTMKNFLYDFVGELGGGDSKTWNFVKAVKRAYEGTRNNRDADLVRRNMKRMGVEYAFLTGIVAMLAAVTAMADDEDNEDLYALQLTNYFMWRLANETSSTQLGIFSELTDVVRSPIVGYQQVENMANIAMIFDGEYASGTYKGHSGAYKYLHTNTVGLKSLHDLKNINTTRDNYEHYNRENIEMSSMFIFNLLSQGN